MEREEAFNYLQTMREKTNEITRLKKRVQELESLESLEQVKDDIIEFLPFGLGNENNPPTEITVRYKSGGSCTMGPNCCKSLHNAVLSLKKLLGENS